MRYLSVFLLGLVMAIQVQAADDSRFRVIKFDQPITAAMPTLARPSSSPRPTSRRPASATR